MCLTAAIGIARELGDRSIESIWRGNLGVSSFMQGAHDAARACFEEALATSRDLGQLPHTATWSNELGRLACDAGDHAAASAHITNALAIMLDIGGTEVNLLEDAARLLAELGDHEAAAEIAARRGPLRRRSGHDARRLPAASGTRQRWPPAAPARRRRLHRGDRTRPPPRRPGRHRRRPHPPPSPHPPEPLSRRRVCAQDAKQQQNRPSSSAGARFRPPKSEAGQPNVGADLVTEMHLGRSGGVVRGGGGGASVGRCRGSWL